MKAYYVYMMTNRSRVVLYTGVTKSVERRLWFHDNASAKSFTNRYKVDRLVYYGRFDNPRDAISREKEIKVGVGKRKIIWCEGLIRNGKIWENSYSGIIGEVPRRLRGSG
jgi:putative endonuclease